MYNALFAPKRPLVKRLSRIRGGYVVPPQQAELIVADHCNIACRSCNHASPLQPRWFASPDQVTRDFSRLARIYRPPLIKVLGGEPLLHKDLLGVVRAARATGLGRYYLLVTNGTLLGRMSDELWRCFDEVQVSTYPGLERAEDNVLQAKTKAARLGVKLTEARFESFRATISLPGTTDSGLVKRIYGACKLANVWGAHSIRDGYFYKCPPSVYIPRLIDGPEEVDRLPIDDRLTARQLLAFVNSPVPLESCRHCLGTVGKAEPHRMRSAAEWRLDVQRSSEEMLDREWLQECERAQTVVNDCSVPSVAPGG